MNLFYVASLEAHAKTIQFDKDESRHIAKVLRFKEGDPIYITNGKGWFFKGTIDKISQKHCIATVQSAEEKKPLPYGLHLAVAPTKNSDRFEWFLEKATEIGINSITPIICEHSERKIIKPDRLEKIIESAMKQSLSCYKPLLHPVTLVQEFIAGSVNFRGTKTIAHCMDTPRKRIKDLVSVGNEILLMIGPEGDFSTNEIQSAVQKGFQPITLGDRRLRTETAAIMACCEVAFVNFP